MLFWMMPDSGPNTKEDIDNFLQQYRKEHPEEEIKVEIFTRHNLWDKLFLLRFEIDPEKIPDIVEVPHSWTQFLIQSNLIENLSLIDPSLSVSKYMSPLIAHTALPGSKDIYALPWWIDVTAMHYRVDHLELVSKDPVKDLSTWGGFLDICAKLKHHFRKTANYFPVQNSDWRGTLSIRAALPCIWGRGVDLFSRDNQKCNFNDPRFVQGMQDYIDLAAHEYLPILRERGSVGTMISGRASLILTRRQGLDIFEDKTNTFEAATLPVPATGQEHISFLSGINLVVIKKSERKEAALNFLRWTSENENQIKYASLMEVFPAAEGSFDEYIFSSPGRMQTYLKIMSGARALPAVMAAATTTKILNEVLDVVAANVVHGNYNKEVLIKELERTSKETDYLLNLYEG